MAGKVRKPNTIGTILGCVLSAKECPMEKGFLVRFSQCYCVIFSRVLDGVIIGCYCWYCGAVSCVCQNVMKIRQWNRNSHNILVFIYFQHKPELNLFCLTCIFHRTNKNLKLIWGFGKHGKGVCVMWFLPNPECLIHPFLLFCCVRKSELHVCYLI